MRDNIPCWTLLEFVENMHVEFESTTMMETTNRLIRKKEKR